MASSLTISVVPIYLMFLMLWAQVNSHDLTEEKVMEFARKFCANEDGLWNMTISCINSIPSRVMTPIMDCAQQIGLPECQTMEDMMTASCNDRSEWFEQEAAMQECMEGKAETMQQESEDLSEEEINAMFGACHPFIEYCIANDLIPNENNLERK